MNTKQIERARNNDNDIICENCMDCNCDDCEKIDTRTVSEIQEDIADEEYHRRKEN